jgi:hypothetical protein
MDKVNDRIVKIDHQLELLRSDIAKVPELPWLYCKRVGVIQSDLLELADDMGSYVNRKRTSEREDQP